MVVYLKRRADFVTYAQYAVTEYDVCLGSIYEENSSITVTGERGVTLGDFAVMAGYIGVIARAVPDRGVTEIVCTDILTAFSRPILYVGSGASVEGFIADGLTAHFKTPGDPVYDMPYLSITADSETPFIKPDTEGGLWNVKSYIAKARRLRRVFTVFTAGREELGVSIGAKTVPLHKVLFNDTAH